MSPVTAMLQRWPPHGLYSLSTSGRSLSQVSTGSHNQKSPIHTPYSCRNHVLTRPSNRCFTDQVGCRGPNLKPFSTSRQRVVLLVRLSLCRRGGVRNVQELGPSRACRGGSRTTVAAASTFRPRFRRISNCRLFTCARETEVLSRRCPMHWLARSRVCGGMVLW